MLRKARRAALLAAIIPLATTTGAHAMECHIEATKSDGMFKIRAFVTGDVNLAGNYTMKSTLQSGSNRSASMQRGKFIVTNSSDPTLLTTSLVSIAPPQTGEIKLTVQSDDRVVDCARIIR